MAHEAAHPMAGQTVKLRTDVKHPQFDIAGQEFRIEDWWDNLTGRSWMDATGNPAAMVYGIRSGLSNLPLDDEVVYGKVGSFGHLIHVSELDLDEAVVIS